MLEVLRPVQGVQDGLVGVGEWPPLTLSPAHTKLLEAGMEQSYNVHRGHLPDISKDDTPHLYYPHHNSEVRDSHENVQKQVLGEHRQRIVEAPLLTPI